MLELLSLILKVGNEALVIDSTSDKTELLLGLLDRAYEAHKQAPHDSVHKFFWASKVRSIKHTLTELRFLEESEGLAIESQSDDGRSLGDSVVPT